MTDQDTDLRYPPAVPGAAEVTGVIEGQVVDPPRAVLPLRVIGTVARHDRTRTVGRHLMYVPLGAAVVGKRLWDSRTTARYERWMRAAEASGDLDRVLALEGRLAEFRRDRHQRRVDMIEVPADLILRLPRLVFGLFLILAGTGTMLAIGTRHLAEVAAPFQVTARAVTLAIIVISVAWGPLLLAVPWIGMAALWHVGRAAAAGGPAGWDTAAPDADREDGGIIVTADTIVLALQHLPIPELRKAFKDGWRPPFHTTPVRDGRGYFTVFAVPLGVTAEMIADRRTVLARNVHRAEVEVWPSDAEKAGTGPAGTVAVWIADSGVLSQAAPEYPLLHDGTADVFAGVPAGVVARGDGIDVPIVGNNFVAGGQMGQGKSNSCRVIMLGCALDPLAELDVFVFANNGDFDAYEPRLAIYVKGVEDDALAAAVARLSELYAEVARREGRLAELGAKKVTRGLAERYPDLRPIVALFSECHELFGHAEYGPIATELVTKTAKRARKTAITLGFDTQSSRKEAIPPKLVELVSVNICFYVKTWRSNDGFLGDGSFAAGIRATELRPGRDRGTSVITGVSDSQFELLRWYFVEVNDDTGFDAAAEVIARSVRQVAPGTPLESAARPAIEAPRDLLDDLDEVLDAERVKLADLPALLRDLAPLWLPYRSLTGVQLRKMLADEGVRVVTKANIPRLDPLDLRRAIAERSTEDLDDENY